MLTIDVKVGHSVQVGDGPDSGVVIKVKAKSGQMARLALMTALPIKNLADGLIPARFTTGITGEHRRVFEVPREAVA